MSTTALGDSVFTGDDLRQWAVVVPDEAGVQAYLAAYTPLAQDLSRICGHVREQFGEAVELSLELYVDPEIADTYLTLYVRQEQYDPSMVNQIDKVRSAFEDQSRYGDGYLLITTDFHPPKNHGI